MRTLLNLTLVTLASILIGCAGLSLDATYPPGTIDLHYLSPVPLASESGVV